MGSWFNFLTLLYIGKKLSLWIPFPNLYSFSFSDILHCIYFFLSNEYVTGVIVLFTVPLFYEKYDDKVDAFAEKAMAEIKKQYVVFDAKVLSKIPRGPLKDKKIAWEMPDSCGSSPVFFFSVLLI